MAPSCAEVTTPVKPAAAGVAPSPAKAAPAVATKIAIPPNRPRMMLVLRIETANSPSGLHHQAIHLDRGSFAAARLTTQGALQLEALFAAGDIDILGIDILAEAGKLEMPLVVGARHQAGIAVLDLGTHLGIGNAAAVIEILGKAEERDARIGIVFLILVEGGTARPRHARDRERKRQSQSK